VLLDVDCAREPYLLWIVQEALDTPLPPKWRVRVVDGTTDSQQEHGARRKDSAGSDMDYSTYMKLKETKHEDEISDESLTREVFYLDVSSGEESEDHPAIG
jgi:hypothetical protein